MSNRSVDRESENMATSASPQPGPGQALVKIAASGVNFIDVYFRIGLYPAPLRPLCLVTEGAGTVEAVGPRRHECRARRSRRLCHGARLLRRICDGAGWQLVKIPESVDFQTAAAAMLQGMTAHYLTHSTYPLKSGDSCLIHAAAGGTGRLLVQMAKMRGAHVVGTVGNEEKARQAKEAGADEVIIYTKEDFVAKAKGKMNVVYDSVGKTTFMQSLDCLRPRGMMVTFGNASGPAPDFSPLILEPERFAVSDSSVACELFFHSGRVSLARRRSVELDQPRQAEAPYSQGLSTR